MTLLTWFTLLNNELRGVVKKSGYFTVRLAVRGGRGAQWAKSEGEAVLLGYSGFTKDPMHDFNRLFC